MPDTPAAQTTTPGTRAGHDTGLPLTLPDTSLTIPRDTTRRDLYPIRQPEHRKPSPRRPSLGARRRQHLAGVI